MSNYQGGVRNRRIRALKRNEVQLTATNKALNTIGEIMTKMETNPRAYDKDGYKMAINNGSHLDVTRKRLESEIQTLKSRI